MRFYILLATIAFFLTSCSSRENTNKKALENVELIELAKESRLDSVKKQEELTVLGSIRFGMNRDEFEKSKDEFMERCKVYNEDGKAKSVKRIGDYDFYYINGYYYKDKLYYVEITGKPIDNDEYDPKMKTQYDALYSVLYAKYGYPTDKREFPSWFSIGHRETYGITVWLKGDKRILLSIEDKYSSRSLNCYSLNLVINQPSISKLLEEESEAKKQNAIKRGVDVL